MQKIPFRHSNLSFLCSQGLKNSPLKGSVNIAPQRGNIYFRRLAENLRRFFGKKFSFRVKRKLLRLRGFDERARKSRK